MSWRLRVPHRLSQPQEAKLSSPPARSSGGQSRARAAGLTASRAFRTARGRGRNPSVSGHHAPYTCPGPVVRVTRRAPQPRPCSAWLSLALPDRLCATARVTWLLLGLVGSLSLELSSWLGARSARGAEVSSWRLPGAQACLWARGARDLGPGPLPVKMAAPSAHGVSVARG